MSPRILVTGATGTVGSETVRELAGRGYNVRAGVHNTSHASAIAGDNVEVVPYDWNSHPSLHALLKGVESAFLITPVSLEQVEWSKTFVECAKVQGLNHLVRLSVLGAESVPGTAVTRAHREIEEYIAASSLHYTFLQPNTFMQNFMRRTSPASGVIYMPLGDGKVSYIDVFDIARVAAEVLINGLPHYGQSYSLTGPKAVSMVDAAAIFSDVLFRHVSYISISPETAEHAMESQGMPRWMAKAMSELYTESRNGLRALVTRDVELLTGRNPRTFEEFCRVHADDLRAPILSAVGAER